MPATADGNFNIYMLNVGQGDTTVVVSPEGSVMIVDAIKPAKLIDFLQNQIGLVTHDSPSDTRTVLA
ncbi:MAG: hypothetical protein AAF802_24855 [Planctomycetota bacterium]